jgi:hypothetical protein
MNRIYMDLARFPIVHVQSRFGHRRGSLILSLLKAWITSSLQGHRRPISTSTLLTPCTMTQPLRPTASIDDHDKEKHAAEHAEYAHSVTAPRGELDVVLPSSLIGLSDEETERMDKRITRRIDWIIMPVSDHVTDGSSSRLPDADTDTDRLPGPVRVLCACVFVGARPAL